MKYIVTKLLTGETLVALQGEMNGLFVNLVYPFEMFKETRYDDNEEPYMFTGLRPYCTVSADPVFKINLAGILFIQPLKDELAEIYCQMVDSFVEPMPEKAEQANTFSFDAPDTLQ